MNQTQVLELAQEMVKRRVLSVKIETAKADPDTFPTATVTFVVGIPDEEETPSS